MDQITRIGLDTSKAVFQLHGVNATEHTVLTRKLTRARMLTFFAALPPCLVILEACGAAHHWARVLRAMGHDVRPIAPHLSKPYVMRGKTDAADAAALCEASSRPRMRFVPVKTPEQQAALMLMGVRDGLIRRRTQLANSIRGYAAEFGLVAAKGLDRIEDLLLQTSSEPVVPDLARRLFEQLGAPPVRAACAGLCGDRGAGGRRRSGTAGLAPGQRAEPAPGREAGRRSGGRRCW